MTQKLCSTDVKIFNRAMELYRDKKVDACFTDQMSGKVTVRKENRFTKFETNQELEDYISTLEETVPDESADADMFPDQEDDVWS